MNEKTHGLTDAELTLSNDDTFYDVDVEVRIDYEDCLGKIVEERISGEIEFTHRVPQHLSELQHHIEYTQFDGVAEVEDTAKLSLDDLIFTGLADENTIEFVARDYELEVYPDEPGDDIQNLDEMETRAISELSGLIGGITDGDIDLVEVGFQRNTQRSYLNHRRSGPSELTIKYNE